MPSSLMSKKEGMSADANIGSTYYYCVLICIAYVELSALLSAGTWEVREYNSVASLLFGRNLNSSLGAQPNPGSAKFNSRNTSLSFK